MKDCSDCGNVQRAGQDSYACKMGNSTYLINNYPEDGKGCVAWKQGNTQKTLKKVNNRDPLLSWLNRANKERERQDSHDIQPTVVDKDEQKIIEAYDNNAKAVGLKTPEIPVQNYVPQQTISDGEVNVKNALGWLIAAVLTGVLIASWLLKLL